MERLFVTNHEHLFPLLNIGLTKEDRKSFSLGRTPEDDDQDTQIHAPYPSDWPKLMPQQAEGNQQLKRM